MIFDNADENTSSVLRRTMKYKGINQTILSSAIAAGRFDLAPIIVQKNPDSLTDSEIESLARVFNRMGENELEKSLEKSLSIPTIRKNIGKISRKALPKLEESIIRYAEKTGNNQLMVDILLNGGDTFHLNYQMHDKARRLAVDSEDISVEDSIRLLKEYGSGGKDKLAIEYLKSMLQTETEQQ